MKRLLACLIFLGLATAQAQEIGYSPALDVGSVWYSPAGTQAWVLPGAVGRINMVVAAKVYENAAWTKTAVQDATFATKTTAPDGSLTGEKFIGDATNGTGFGHVISQSITKIGISQTYTCTVFAKPAEYTRMMILVANSAPIGSNGADVIFDMAGVQVGVAPTTYGAGYSIANPSIISVGNGWIRAKVDVTVGAQTAMFPQILLDNGSGNSADGHVFVGNGTSGIYLWTANCLPQGAWSFTSQVFSEDFTTSGTSTIDVNDSRTAGFKWYTHAAWPNASNYTNFGGNAWRTAVTTPAGNISSNASGMTLSADASTFGNDLSTTGFTSGSSFVGQAFGAGGLRECSISFNPANAATGQTSWPACFSITQEFLIGNSNEFIEPDWFEAIPTGAGTFDSVWSFHDWTIVALTVSDNNVDIHHNVLNTDGLSHRYSLLWIKSTQNGGLGYITRYFDGVLVPGLDVIYSAGAGSNPAAVPSNPNGQFFAAESHTFPVILGTFHNPDAPTTFQSVSIWQ